MNIVYFSSDTFGLPTLHELLKSRHKVISLVTSSDKPRGRGLRVTSTPFKEAAKKEGVPVIEADAAFSPEKIEILRELSADIFVVVSFGVIFPQEFLEIPVLGSLNLHASLLPKYRGAAPIAYALLNGDEETGVTTMRMSGRLDAGDVLLQERMKLRGDENCAFVKGVLSQMGAEVVLKTLDLLEAGKMTAKPQDEALATRASKIKKKDGRIDWSVSAESIHNRVRAFSLWPGSRTSFKGKDLIILKTLRCQDDITDAPPPGTIMESAHPEGIRVAAGTKSLYIQELKPEGKRAMSARAFVNGHSVQTGERFE